MIVLSKQIATCGKIHDFYEANSYYKQIVSQEWADWNQFSGFFLPLKEKLIDEFKALINKPMVRPQPPSLFSEANLFFFRNGKPILLLIQERPLPRSMSPQEVGSSSGSCFVE